jgi:hypothetical protein
MCRIRVTRDQTRRAMETVKAFNGLEGHDTALIRALDLVKESQPNFPGGPDAPFFQSSIADLATVAGVALAVQQSLPHLE